MTAAYIGTDNFQIVIFALQVAYSNFAALDSLADSSYVDSSLLQVPLYASGLIHTYNLPNITLASPLVRFLRSSAPPACAVHVLYGRVCVLSALD